MILTDVQTALPLPGDSEEGSDKLPPVGFGVHVHAEVHGSLQELTQRSLMYTPITTHLPSLICNTELFQSSSRGKMETCLQYLHNIILFVSSHLNTKQRYNITFYFTNNMEIMLNLSLHLVYKVSVDTVGELLDEGVHDQLQVGPCVCLLILLFYTYKNKGLLTFTLQTDET